MLLHVAEEGFANPREHRTVRDLLRRGLLVLGPELRVFSLGFQSFLQQVRDSNLVKQLERPGRFGWSQAKWALTVVVVGIIVFLVGTQRQSIGPVVTLVTTLTGGRGNPETGGRPFARQRWAEPFKPDLIENANI